MVLKPQDRIPFSRVKSDDESQAEWSSSDNAGDDAEFEGESSS